MFDDESSITTTVSVHFPGAICVGQDGGSTLLRRGQLNEAIEEEEDVSCTVPCPMLQSEEEQEPQPCRRLLNLMWWDSETRTELGTIVTGIWDTILFGTWVGFDSGPDKCD
jgi:hypothetical protein